MEAPTLAQKDYFSAALIDYTLGNLQVTHGTQAGNMYNSQALSRYGDVVMVKWMELQMT